MRKNILDTFKNESGIYAIICKHERKIYIGQSRDMKTRIKTHITALEKCEHVNIKMQNDYNKYKETFIFIPLEYTNEIELTIIERYYISLLCLFGYELYNAKYISSPSLSFYEIFSKRNEGFGKIYHILK